MFPSAGFHVGKAVAHRKRAKWTHIKVWAIWSGKVRTCFCSTNVKKKKKKSLDVIDIKGKVLEAFLQSLKREQEASFHLNWSIFYIIHVRLLHLYTTCLYVCEHEVCVYAFTDIFPVLSIFIIFTIRAGCQNMITTWQRA